MSKEVADEEEQSREQRTVVHGINTAAQEKKCEEEKQKKEFLP